MKKFIFATLIILSSSVLFAQWTSLNSGSPEYLSAIHFISADTGFVGGNASVMNTTLLKTTNGGLNWTPVNISTVNSIRSIFFTDSQHGFLTTNSATEGFKTEDGGTTWVAFDTEIFNTGDIYFKDSDTGFVYSPNNGDDVSFTFDGGETWTRYPNGTFGGAAISSIHFPDLNSGIGFATTAWGGQVYKTSNGGITWDEIAQPTGQVLNDVYFISANEGFIIGSNFILKTTDGGLNWSVFSSDTGGKKVRVVDSIIYALNNSDVFSSDIATPDFNPMSGTTTVLTNLHLFSASSGYCIGSGGSIYKLDLSNSVANQDLKQFNFYPNPTNAEVTIHMPSENGQLTITDLHGKQLLQKEVTSGQHISLSEAASGIYLFELKTTSGTYFRKIIKN